MNCPVEVVIVDDFMVSALDVYRDHVLEIFCVGFSIDLIPIPLRDVCVILGMDWLIRFRAPINYERQLMVVRTSSGGELTIYDKGTTVGSDFYSNT